MRLLAPITRSRLWRHRDVSWAAFAVAVGLAIEMFGRESRSELLDAASVLVLVAFIGVSVAWHQGSPLAVVRGVHRVLALLGRILKRSLTEFGADLRGEPRLPRRLPRLQLRMIVLLAVAMVLVSGENSLIHIRDFLADSFYVGNAAFLAVLWVLLGLGTFAMLCLFLGVIHDELTLMRSSKGRGLRIQVARLIGVALALSVVGFLLPTELPAVIIMGATVMSLVWLLPFGPKLTLLWRTGGSRRQVYGTSIGTVNVMVSLILGLTAETLVFLTRVGPVVEGTGMPFTATVGMVFGWSAAAGLLAVQIHGTMSFWRDTREDPARPCSPVLHVSGRVSTELQSYIERGLGHQGWAARFAPEVPDLTDVRVALDGEAVGQGSARVRRVTVTELDHPVVLRELRIRGVKRKRMLLRHALKNLLEHALKRSYRKGTGFWVNPHHWFAVGITRDTEEDELVSEDGFVLHSHVGQPYRLAISRPVRNHLFEVLKVLELDLLYLQDGVSFARFWAVIEVLFRVHDETGARVEEHQLSGISGVRTLIHDFVLEEPVLRNEGFPEPDYEDIGRGRILHVFKDLGENQEPSETPVERIPRPLSLFPL